MRIEAWMLVLMMAFLVGALAYAGLNFAAARQEIAQFNAQVIERCEIVECAISPLGDLDCRTSVIPDVWKSENPEFRTINNSIFGGAG